MHCGAVLNIVSVCLIEISSDEGCGSRDRATRQQGVCWTVRTVDRSSDPVNIAAEERSAFLPKDEISKDDAGISDLIRGNDGIQDKYNTALARCTQEERSTSFGVGVK